MKQFFTRTVAFFNTIESKIAFYPTIFAIFGFLLSSLMKGLESLGLSKKLLEIFPNLILEDGDTALTILSTCVSGIISIMVFSFSMVMLLLSQASSNFSPRLLPGLISDKKHQIILGTYLSSIIYIIFTLFSIEPDDKKYTLPGISILLAIALTIACLGAFISFIHNISQSIQINNILDKIYNTSRHRLAELITQETEETDTNTFKNTTKWYSYSVDKSGYFQNISLDNLVEWSYANKTKLYIAKPKGFFVLQHKPFIFSEKELNEDDVSKILKNISFSRGELVNDNYVLAFKQITEIAVKAMSPGINDPGTAINAIDYLTELFSYRMKKTNNSIHSFKKVACVKIAVVSFEELLYNCMASLRTYCKHDPILVHKLLHMLMYLKNQKACQTKYNIAIEDEIESLVFDAKEAFSNKRDENFIEEKINT